MIYHLAIFLLVLAIVACEERESAEISQKLKTYLDTTQTQAQKAFAKRAKAGDTIAHSTERLAQALPQRVGEYEGQDFLHDKKTDLDGRGYQSVERVYKKNNHQLLATLSDYRGGTPPHTQLVALWRVARRIDTDTESGFPVKISSRIIGWAHYDKSNRRAELQLAVNDYILLRLLGYDCLDAEILVSFAKRMPLQDLCQD